jgi:hypothetical protein
MGRGETTVKKLIGLFSLVILLPAATTNMKQNVYPNRWVRIASRLADDNDVEKVLQIAGTAAQHGLNGIVFSAGLDELDLKSPEYFRRLNQVRDFCNRQKLEIIPSIMSAGYGGSVLAHDKNLAAGLLVKDALFVATHGNANLVQDPPVRLANGSFEESDGEMLKGFSFPEKMGEAVHLDRQVAKDGKASVRFDRFGQYAKDSYRISQAMRVRPYRCYRLSAWVRSEGLGKSDPFGSGNFRLDVLGGDDKRPLQYENPRMTGDSGWQEVAVGFNSWNYDHVEIVPSVKGQPGGKFWLDDLQIEEIALVNLLRRPGTPLIVRAR